MINEIWNCFKQGYNYLNQPINFNNLFKPKQEEVNEFNLQVGQTIKYNFNGVYGYISRLDLETCLAVLNNSTYYSKLFDNTRDAYYYLDAMYLYSLEFD